MNWYAIETKPKAEEDVERDLRLAGITVYSPIARTERWSKRKKVHVERVLRLMPRYLFVEVGGAGALWDIIRGAKGVHRALGAGGVPARLNSLEVKALEAVIAAEGNLEFDTTRSAKIRRGEIGKTKRDTARIHFPVGSKVRIAKGPLTAFTAEVTTVTGRGKLEALVSVFGRMASVEIDAEWVELEAA